MYAKLKSAEEEQKKAEVEADKYYDQFCKEEAKVAGLEEDIIRKGQEIAKLKEEIEKMVSAGYIKSDDNVSVLKKKFTEIKHLFVSADCKVLNIQVLLKVIIIDQYIHLNILYHFPVI